MKPLLFSLASKKWTRLAEGELGYPSWSRDSKFIYLQDWSHGSPRISRLRLSDHTLEVLMEFSDVKECLAWIYYCIERCCFGWVSTGRS